MKAWTVVLRRVCIVFAVVWLGISAVIWTYGANPFERNPLSGMCLFVSLAFALATFISATDALE